MYNLHKHKAELFVSCSKLSVSYNICVVSNCHIVFQSKGQRHDRLLSETRG